MTARLPPVLSSRGFRASPLTTPLGRRRPRRLAACRWPSSGTALLALFRVYLVLLVWTVLWKLETPWTGEDAAIKLVPFASTGEAGASTPLEVVVNLLLFLPFGLYLGLLRPAWSWPAAAGVFALASLALEVTQYVLAVGRSDVTDVVVNTAGGLLGIAAVALSRHGLRGRTAPVVMRVCTVGTALVLLAAAFYVTSPVRLVHVRDVGPLAGAPPSLPPPR